MERKRGRESENVGVSVFVDGCYSYHRQQTQKHSTTHNSVNASFCLLSFGHPISLSLSLSICLYVFFFFLSSSHLALPIERAASVCLYMVIQFGYGRPEKAAEDTKDDVREQLDHRPVLYNMRQMGGERRLDTELRFNTHTTHTHTHTHTHVNTLTCSTLKFWMTLECFMVPEKLLRHMRVTKAGGEKTNVHTSHVRTIATFILILYILLYIIN